jgi:hypothetical protein
MMLQTRVDRAAVNPDTPATGLTLKDWEFVPTPPTGAMIANPPGARAIFSPPPRNP